MSNRRAETTVDYWGLGSLVIVSCDGGRAGPETGPPIGTTVPAPEWTADPLRLHHCPTVGVC